MNKKVLLSAIVGALTLGLAACGPTNPTTNPTDPSIEPSVPEYTPVISEPVEISMWVKSDQNSKLYQSFAERFKEVEPNVTVKVEALESVKSYNDIQTLVLTGILAKQYPNIVQAYPGHVADYYAQDIVVNLDSYIDNDSYGWTTDEKSKFNLKAGQQFGFEGTYCVPFNKSSEVLYYNRDKLVGLNLSTINNKINNGRTLTDNYLQNLTWEELFGSLAPALIQYNEEHPEENLINTEDENWAILFHEDDANHFITTTKQYNAPYTSVDAQGNGSILFNCDETKAVKRYFTDAVTNRYLATRWSSGGAYSANQLLTGASLFAINSTVGASYFYHNDYVTDIGIGHVPYAQGQKRYVIEQGVSLSVLSKGNDLQDLASWLFYKFMTSYDNQLEYSLTSGYLPIRSDIYDDPAYIAANDLDQFSGVSAERIIAQVFNFSENLLDDYFTEAPFKGSTAVRNAVSYLNSGLYGEAKKGIVSEEKFNEAFTTAYNNAVNDSK